MLDDLGASIWTRSGRRGRTGNSPGACAGRLLHGWALQSRTGAARARTRRIGAGGDQREKDPRARAGCLPFAYWALGDYKNASAALNLHLDKYADLNGTASAQVYAYEG